MSENSKELLRELAKEFYDSYVSPTPILSRFNVLWPLYAALGAGFFYAGTNFPHFGTDGNIVLFFIPYGIGLLILLASFSLALYAMFWLNEIEILGDPNEYKKCLEAVKEENDKNAFEHYQKELIDRRCKAASRCIKLFTKRAHLLHRASQLGVFAFIGLALSIPRLISTYNFHH